MNEMNEPLKLNLGDEVKIFVLKVDCEGYDHFVLEGATPLLPYRTFFIFFEKNNLKLYLVF